MKATWSHKRAQLSHGCSVFVIATKTLKQPLIIKDMNIDMILNAYFNILLSKCEKDLFTSEVNNLIVEKYFENTKSTACSE